MAYKGNNLMALNNISEGTRRSIVDIFSVSKISWAGRLREDDFLARLYDLTDLTKMGSTDYRIPNAKGDIVQHRVHLMLGRERYVPTRNAWISGSLNQRVQGLSQGQQTIPANVPQVGLIPTMPQAADGILIEPSVSLVNEP